MKLKTLKLQWDILDYFVAKAQWSHIYTDDASCMQIARRQHYSTSWEAAGRIIESECIELRHNPDLAGRNIAWLAVYPRQNKGTNGTTPLVAAMRCYVRAKFGDEVDIPQEFVHLIV